MGFVEILLHAHTPTSNDPQSNVNDDQREVSNRVGHRSADKKKASDFSCAHLKHQPSGMPIPYYEPPGYFPVIA
ncbi:unnamed protein product [Larinioides sclopetarius]|uniref:Uncharacterized protein n=1 Tax=Larinioides sclopetarius TaxID=280406 RepID=A0AAV2AUK4_9ARAC